MNITMSQKQMKYLHPPKNKQQALMKTTKFRTALHENENENNGMQM